MKRHRFISDRINSKQSGIVSYGRPTKIYKADLNKGSTSLSIRFLVVIGKN